MLHTDTTLYISEEKEEEAKDAWISEVYCERHVLVRTHTHLVMSVCVICSYVIFDLT